MKKGDTIHKREEIESGRALMHGFESLDKAEVAMRHIGEYYNLPSSAMLKCGYDEDNNGKFAVIADGDTYVTIEAVVNWVVDQEAGITYVAGGSGAVVDLSAEEHKGWVVIKSQAPVYQSSVEHMTDEELRASIESLRTNRIARPVVVKKTRAVKVKEAPMSAQDKALSGMLASMNPDEREALQRKLGLI